MTQRASKAKTEGQKLLDEKINLSPQNTGKICVCIHTHTHVCVYIYIYIYLFKTYTSFISLKSLKFVFHLHIKIQKWEFFSYYLQTSINSLSLLNHCPLPAVWVTVSLGHF